MPETRRTLHERFGGQCTPEDIGGYVFVPGSQRRARQLAEAWKDPREIASHYEFLVLSGKLNETSVTACSTGIGGRSTSIAVTELAELGGHTFVRVGVTGSLQPEVQVGDLIIASAAVRMDKTSEHFVTLAYPALAHFEVLVALIAAAQDNDFRYHVGISATSSSFYCGEGSSGFNGYRHSGMDAIESDLQAARVYDWDTETATLFTLCGLYGLRAGRVNAVVDDPETGVYNPIGEANAVKTALDAVRILSAWDQDKKKTCKRFTLPAYPASLQDQSTISAGDD
ncbi:MAG: nucleoside phosphorylase [Anaerolineales bacterium]|nr:nucleoside phosphorylase [Anaerolineales bacterium]